MAASVSDGQGPSPSSPLTEAKLTGRQHQKRLAKKKRKSKKKGPPQHWRYVSYADIRQIIEKTEGVPREAVEALTVAFFLSARRPPGLSKLWNRYKQAMIKLAKWVSEEGGPYIMNHIGGVERAFSEPFMGATLKPGPATDDYEPTVVGEVRHPSAGVEHIPATSNDSAELAMAAYREVQKLADRGRGGRENVVSVPVGVEGNRGPQRLVVFRDATVPWDFLPGRDGRDHLQRRPRPRGPRAGRASRSGLIIRRPSVEQFMRWGILILEGSGCRPSEASERILPVGKKKRKPRAETETTLKALDRLMALLYPPPSKRDSGKSDGRLTVESLERDTDGDDLPIPEEVELRDIDNIARQARRDGVDKPGTNLNTIREVLEAAAVEFKNRSWWIPDDRK